MSKPKHYLVFKILAVIFAAVSVWGIVLSVKGFGDFESNNFMIGSMIMPFGVFLTVTCGLIGFKSEMMKMSTKSAKYIQQENKEDLADIAKTHAEIQKEAVKTTAGAVKEGLTDTKSCKVCGAKVDEDAKFCEYCGAKVAEEPKYCKHCGAEISESSRFCSECGGEL